VGFEILTWNSYSKFLLTAGVTERLFWLSLDDRIIRTAINNTILIQPIDMEAS